MPAKILGILLLLAGLWLQHGVTRARKRGYVGPKYRRIHRETDRKKFNVALGSQWVGAWICFLGGFMCLTHILVR